MEISKEAKQYSELEAIGQWTFELNPIQSNVYYKNQTKVDITPIHKNGKYYGIHPIFDKEGISNNQGFILQVQKLDQETFINGSVLSIQEKQALQNQQNIQIPRPLTTKNVCMICRERYVDYLEHIMHKSHNKKIRNNQFTKHIDQMCGQFKQSCQQPIFIGKRKLNTEGTNGSYQTAQDPNKNPTKKRFVEKSSNLAIPTSTKHTDHSREGKAININNNYFY